jgi:hypothetical protein
MEAGELLLIIASCTLAAFTLGAGIAHRLEGRTPLTQPAWLVSLTVVTFVVVAVSVVVATDRPTGVITIDPFWWTVMDVLILGSALLAAALRLGRLFRERRSGEATS